MQILVVVANIQARSLRAEVEKGFARTAIGRELADPKPEINFEEETIDAFRSRGVVGWVSFDGEREVGQNSDVRIRVSAEARSDLGDAGRPPGKSFLFLLTVSYGPGIASRGGRTGASEERFYVSKRPEWVGRPLKIRASITDTSRTGKDEGREPPP